MASDTPSDPKPGSSNNSTSSETKNPPASPPPPPASPPPPSPPSSPPPPPASSPPPPQSPPPSSPDQKSSSPPPPTKQASPASPPPPEKSNSSTPPKNSESSPEGSTPPSSPSPHSPGTPSPPSPHVATHPPPHASTAAGSALSPPPPILESTPGTPATNASSTSHSPPSHSPPNAKESSTSSSSANHFSSPQSSDSLSSTDAWLIGGLIGAGLFVIALIIVCVACSRRKRKQQYYMAPNPRPNDQFYNGAVQYPHDHVVKLSPAAGNGWGAPPPPPSGNISSEFNNSSGQNHGQHSPKMGGIGGFNQSQFTYEELAAATGGFSQSNLIGQGGFGFVHKGVLPDKREIAVKSLKTGSGQGEREFQAEVDIISRVHHRHLVSLYGYCITDKQRMLVYEYVPNKTLEFHLHGAGNSPMDWSARLRIALGSAKGLAYLHEDCHPRIIHRDIKAANILLDDNFEAMVADFGLAKLTSDNYTHVSTRVMGTFGYLAPEYAQSGKLTEKSDVFSFGVMLLELITGRRPVDTTNRMMEDSLVDWARPLLTKALEDGNYDELADPLLEGNYIPHEMARMVACASASIRHSARRRPKMSQIVRSLQGDSALEELNNEGAKPGNNNSYNTTTSAHTTAYDTGAYNADMMKFRKMIMPSQEFTSGDCGVTSEYGLNPSSSSSDVFSGPQKPN